MAAENLRCKECGTEYPLEALYVCERCFGPLEVNYDHGFADDVATLRRRIRLGAFAALDQRVALHYAMTGMEAAETADYVVHHLKIAGRSDTLFSDDALALIHQVSRGLPRAVNNLAVQSLVAAFAESKAIVDESSARAAITEVTAD